MMLYKKAVRITRIDSREYPARFFEVELLRPRRIANDMLMNESEIESYLEQTCPCCFSPGFKHGPEIDSLLSSYGRAGHSYRIYFNGADLPIFRPYRDTIRYSESRMASIGKLKTFNIKGIDDEIAAIGWFTHHEYQGAIPVSVGVRGLRARIGNIQIGDERVFSNVFPEERFCSWTIGEVHVLDPRVVPNGRRDAFEANIQLDNITTHLRPAVSEIARECRLSSIRRNRRKAIEIREGRIREKLEIIRQGAISEHHENAIRIEIGSLMVELHKAVQSEMFDDVETAELRNRYDDIEAQVDTLIQDTNVVAFESLPKRHQKLYRDIFDLIYDCSVNKVAAKHLVDSILDRISKK